VSKLSPLSSGAKPIPLSPRFLCACSGASQGNRMCENCTLSCVLAGEGRGGGSSDILKWPHLNPPPAYPEGGLTHAIALGGELSASIPLVSGRFFSYDRPWSDRFVRGRPSPFCRKEAGCLGRERRFETTSLRPSWS